MFLTRSAVKAAIALTWMVSASAGASVGYVYEAVGEVSIAAGKTPALPAAKNTEILTESTISTGDQSAAVLKFEDGQIATLQSNTAFHVSEYVFQPNHPEKSNIVFSKLKGGMRFVTGLIGQTNHEAFRLTTPNATIGIRGTEFMVATVNDALYGKVISGSISMTNAAGVAVFSAGQTVLVESANTLPKAISAADLPAGIFSQLVTIPAALPLSDKSLPTSAAAADAALFAVPEGSGNGSGTQLPAPKAPVSSANAKSSTNPSESSQVVDVVQSTKEINGLPFFKAISKPVRTPASDVALAAATGDSARAAAAAATISRNEAAAGLFGNHNFTPTGIATGEICAFCHTPQGAEVAVAAPLWNRSAPPLSPYLAYSTLASATDQAAGSVSIACLSCHDGTQAPNVLIRIPDANIDADTGRHRAPASVRNDLRNHHPVSMRYAGGGQDQNMPNAPLNVPSGAGGQNLSGLGLSNDASRRVEPNTFNNVDFKMTSHSGTSTGTVWWVDTGGKGRQKNDLYLFTRTDTTNYSGVVPVAYDVPVNQPYVECATCHDPHRVTLPTFLRIPNAGSAVCLTCHNK